ncbi:FAD-dependent oxidoreductase, partial [Ruegeria sp. NA]|nr:FAD-dependent oxidoreductase [Ruegeria sp. NA]
MWRTTCTELVTALPLRSDTTVDLAIIGGGYTGCSAALTAARSGASVCLLEAQKIGFGGSGRNVGLVN